MALFIATLLLLCVAAIIAFWLGGPPEKAVAVIIAIMTVIAVVGHSLIPFEYAKIDVVNAVSDCIGMIGLCVIALFARRVWPLWVSSLQLISLMAHAVRGLEIPVHPIAYAIMSMAPSDLIPITLIVGSLNHWLKKRRGDNSPSWRSWSAQLNQ